VARARLVAMRVDQEALDVYSVVAPPGHHLAVAEPPVEPIAERGELRRLSGCAHAVDLLRRVQRAPRNGKLAAGGHRWTAEDAAALAEAPDIDRLQAAGLAV